MGTPMIDKIKKHYLKKRLETVDKDFLVFEENMILEEDINYLKTLLDCKDEVKLLNPHNSIILYLCGLTNQFDFIKGRSDTTGGSPPDIDIDHDALDRDEAIQWVIDYWGRDHVANIITHGTFKPKSLTRSFYRVTEGPTDDLNDLLKKIPPPKYGKEASLGEILDKNPDIKEEDRFSDYYRFANTLEDMVANFGIHAAGLVISDFPIYETVPMWKNSKSDRITQFDMKEVEDLGLIKFDFLSIDTLSIIKEAVRLIKETKNIEINPYQIPDGDKKAYTMLHEGLLTGVFQMETSGMAKKLISRIRPNSIEELSDINALNRPGPLQANLDKMYIKNKNNSYPDDSLPEEMKNILSDTYWTLIYQEQVMAICSKLAGFSQKESDDIRRAMGKKDARVLDSYKQPFIENCVKNTSLTKDYSVELWEDLLGFADYCFNKAHSVSYSMLTYISAYLKANYPVEFFCALMSTRSKTLQPKLWANKAPEYIQEAKILGVTINPPSVNGSDLAFTIKDNEVYFGLNAIRDVGKTAARSIVSTRGKKPFQDIDDFLGRNNLRKVTIKTFQSLIRSGAFDKLGYLRSNLLEESSNLYDYTRDIVEAEQRKIDILVREKENEKLSILIENRNSLRKELKVENRNLKKASPETKNKVLDLIDHIENQLEPLEEMKLRKKPMLKPKEIPEKIELIREKEVPLSLQEMLEQAHYIGCYISIHPAKLINNDCEQLSNVWAGSKVRVCGVVNSLKIITTKRGQKMAFLELDDSTASADVTIFPRLWKNLSEKGLIAGSLIKMDAKIEQEEPIIKIIAENVQIHKE